MNAYQNHVQDGWPGNGYLLSGRARNASEEGHAERFHMKDFSDAEHGRLREPDVYGKIRLMLRWFEGKSTRIGDWIAPVQSTDYPIAYCRDEHEWNHLLNDVATPKGWLKPDHTGQRFHLTFDGREWLHQVAPASSTQPKESSVSNLPAHFTRFQPDLERFAKDGAYEDSVFVMMKFPDEKRMPATTVELLKAIFVPIRDELDRHGLRARRADDKIYSPQLWDNVCIYMLGCKYGLAVLEDLSGDEFNPNVALEYGFMLSLGRQSVLFTDGGFKKIRADIAGTVRKGFSIGDEKSLRAAVEDWMVDIDRGPKRRR